MQDLTKSKERRSDLSNGIYHFFWPLELYVSFPALFLFITRSLLSSVCSASHAPSIASPCVDADWIASRAPEFGQFGEQLGFDQDGRKVRWPSRVDLDMANWLPWQQRSLNRNPRNTTLTVIMPYCCWEQMACGRHACLSACCEDLFEVHTCETVRKCLSTLRQINM